MRNPLEDSGNWKIPLEVAERLGKERAHIPPMFFLMSPDSGLSNAVGKQLTPLLGSPPFTSKDEYELDGFCTWRFFELFHLQWRQPPSNPSPTVPITIQFHFGTHRVDMYPTCLRACICKIRRIGKHSRMLLRILVRNAGLFNEINIRSLGERASDPFQLQVRKFEGKRKGLWHQPCRRRLRHQPSSSDSYGNASCRCRKSVLVSAA